MKNKLLALLFGSALILAACGGGDDTANEGANDADNDVDTEQTEQPEQTGQDEGAEGTEGTDEGADEGTEGTTSSVNAEEIYKQSCASCHGGNLEGGVGPELAAIGGKYSAQEIEDIIKNGQGTMPPNIIQGEEATAVAEWLAGHQ